MGSRASALRASALTLLALVVALVVGAGSASAQGTTRRIAGTDRYATMDALVREGFSSSEWAVVATAESFPDALAAAPVAGARQCPVILTASSELSAQARSLIQSLAVKNVLIMGGEGAVSAAVESSLTSLGVACERVSGSDRVQTSVLAYDKVRSQGSASNTVIVTTGSGFADALAVGPYAWKSASPILLTDASGKLSAEAVAKVKADASVTRIVLVGGTAVVSDAVRDQLGDAYTFVRLAGSDRYQTAAEVARWSCENGLSWSSVAVATGTGFADALAAAPTLGKSATPLLLVSGAANALIREKASSINTCYVLGGTAAVSEAQERDVTDALAGTSSRSGSSSSSSSYAGGSSYYSNYYNTGYTTTGRSNGYDYYPSTQPSVPDVPVTPTDDGHQGETTPEEWGAFQLWPDEEDVLIPGGSGKSTLKTALPDNPQNPIFAQAEEADLPVSRTEQTFYVQAPKDSSAPTLYVKGDAGSDKQLGQMTVVSAQEVKALNDQYAGNSEDDTGDEYIKVLDPDRYSYWKYTLTTLPTEEVTVTYVARTATLTSNECAVDYWLPFTDDELNVLKQVDDAVDALLSDESYWQKSSEQRKELALALIKSLAEKGLVESDSWQFNEQEGIWTFNCNQDKDESDDDGVVCTLETQITEQRDEYAFDEEVREADEPMPYSDDVPGEDAEGADGGIMAMSEPLVAQATTLTSKKALILNAFPAFEKKVADRLYRYSFYRKLKQDWNAKGITTTLWESKITVNAFSYLNKFDCVIIATHGARYQYWTGPKNNRKLRECSAYSVCQGRRDRSYAKMLKDRQIVKSDRGYWVLPKYFSVHYSQGSFRSVVVGSESCSNFGRNGKTDTELPGVFTSKGATAAVGFHNTVISGYGRNFLKVFFESMFKGNAVGASVSAAMDKVGKTQLDWWTKNFREPYYAKHTTNCFPMYVGQKYGRLI